MALKSLFCSYTVLGGGGGGCPTKTEGFSISFWFRLSLGLNGGVLNVKAPIFYVSCLVQVQCWLQDHVYCTSPMLELLLPDPTVPRSQSGAVPKSSLLGGGSWGYGKLGRVGQLGEGWGK